MDELVVEVVVILAVSAVGAKKRVVVAVRAEGERRAKVKQQQQVSWLLLC